jgi:hypothetical protein
MKSLEVGYRFFESAARRILALVSAARRFVQANRRPADFGPSARRAADSSRGNTEAHPNTSGAPVCTHPMGTIEPAGRRPIVLGMCSR